MCSTYGYNCHYQEDKSPTAAFVAHPPSQQAANGARSPHSAAHKSGRAKDYPSTLSRTRRDSSSTPPDPGVFDPHKSRFVGPGSAGAFAHSLGREFQSERPPRLHSFGYTFGTRPEESPEVHEHARTLISEAEVKHYSSVFFDAAAPVFDLLDRDVYEQQCHDYFNSVDVKPVDASIIAGVAAIGSFLSVAHGHPNESEIVRCARKVLEDPASIRRPTISLIVGSVLRTVYLRATTRPTNAWLASCTTMHLIEAIGMHDESNLVRLASFREHSGANETPDPERLRRVFWISWSLNILTSFEYGRNHVMLPHITCAELTPRLGSVAHLQVRIAQTVPAAAAPSVYLTEALKASIIALSSIPDEHPFTTLSKTDMCFCNYRRLRARNPVIGDDIAGEIISMGNRGLEAASQLVREGRPWWSALGSTFQYTCVLLALDTPTSLLHVARVFQVFEEIVKLIDTRLTREALNTARLLLKDAMAKKKRELQLLEAADVPETVPTDIPDDVLSSVVPGYDLGCNIDWDQILNDSYATFFADTALGPPV